MLTAPTSARANWSSLCWKPPRRADVHLLGTWPFVLREEQEQRRKAERKQPLNTN